MGPSATASENATRDDGLTAGRFGASAREWDALVHRSDGASFCHLAGWREIVEGVLGHEWLPLAALDENGTPRGILPLVRVKSRLLGHHLISMPFLNYGGPIGDDRARTHLVEAAVTEADRSGADLLEVRARTPIRCELPAGRPKITVLLELPNDAEELWRDRFSSKLRNQIRRPRKAGMKARIGSEQIKPFYDVFSRHMRDLGTPVLPRDIFDRIAGVFDEHVVFAAVYRRGRPVAAGCGFVWRDEFEITWASALREYRREAPNMMLYWSLMEEMIGRGLRVFNFGRCTPNGGTHRFKRQWGGEDLALPWVQWSARAGASAPSPQRWRYRAASAIWRRLPLNLTRRFGPLLARSLP